jgi:threonine/homoserine/homoserine lactone efflux protein
LELVNIFNTAFLIGFSGAVVPGPLLSITINESMRRGMIAGPLVVCGHGLLEIVLVVGLALGLNTILSIPAVSLLIALIGGVVLLWLGYSIIRGASGENELYAEKESTLDPKGAWYLPVVAGAVTSLSNPYWLLWWAAVGAALIVKALAQGWAGLVSFFMGHVLADLTWYLLVAIMVVTGKRFLGKKTYRGILIGCGLLLVIFGVYFILSAFGVVGSIGG